MLIIDKKIGETPLELLDRLRRERPELGNEKLSYAGRLDPMAEGSMLILVGEENKDRDKYLGFDKEYVAEFLIGTKTDTGDVLGLIGMQGYQKEGIEIPEISKEMIENKVKKLLNIKEQKYPWFSGRTVNGVKLFDHYKSGNLDIERPIQKVVIKEVELLDFKELDVSEIEKYIFDSIAKVSGDFRQKKIIKNWQDFFTVRRSGIADSKKLMQPADKMLTFQIRIVVSAGTYIRALTENFDWPATLLKLKRTRIFV